MIVFLLGAQLYLFLSQLLEAIGVISTKDAKKVKGQNSSYQDVATALVDCSHSNKAVLQDNDKSNNEENNDILPGSFSSDLCDDIFASVNKVSYNYCPYEILNLTILKL